MAKDKFTEQFGDYPLIPEKKYKKLYWVAVWIAFLVPVIALPTMLFYALGTINNPQANMSGNNSFTAQTAGLHAEALSQAGQHAEAIANFTRYFAMGGNEADMMAQYAYSLSETGRKDEAKQWADRAIQADPQSKAAKIVHDALSK
ncbi:MAG TPA: tetratricopeptide repeat protein [Bdellovibrionales bacterium]|nr:tetratricopeptide repeat protein [Bdellovibrionales bacterium]